MRAVLDTNVIVSAVLSQGSPPDAILRAWRKGAFQLVTSAPLLEELEAVLSRPHIAERLSWSERERRVFIATLSESAIVVEPKRKLAVIKADPADNKVLEAAVAGHSDYIVSGDSHLLAPRVYEDIQILTPTRFAAVLTTPH